MTRLPAPAKWRRENDVKCIVTGGNGFLGTHVVAELLTRGFGVVVYDIASDEARKGLARVEFIQDDVRNIERLRVVLENADAVFHLSGVLGTEELFDSPEEAIDINIHGALNILLTSSNTGRKKCIFFPTKPNEWNNVYSATSQAVEKLGHAYRESMGLDIRVLRFWNVYGPGQKLFPVRKAVPLFIFSALENKPIEIFGDGTQIVELLYAQDVAKSIVDYVVYDGVVLETYELSSGVRMTVEALARRLIAMIGSKSEVTFLPMRKGEASSIEFARARDVRQILGESKTTSFDDGMRKTIEWYRGLSDDALENCRSFYGRK